MAERETLTGGELEELTENIGRLADRLQVVGDSLDAIGEDLNWLTRNPLRIEVEAVLFGGRYRVGGIAGDDCGEAGRLDASSEANAAVSRVAECLQRTLATISAEQVEALLATLDEAQGHLLQLMRGEVREALHAGQALLEPARFGSCDETMQTQPTESELDTESAVAASDHATTEPTVVTLPKSSGPPGRLF